MKRIGILTAGDTPVLNAIIQPDIMLVLEIAPDWNCWWNACRLCMIRPRT